MLLKRYHNLQIETIKFNERFMEENENIGKG